MERFAAKLKEVVDYHNFALTEYYKADPVDYEATLAEAKEWAAALLPMKGDVTKILHDAREAGADILFEGAQGSLLDIDHGTYPYVTSSNTTAGGAATGTGFGPLYLDYILGITKAYTTVLALAHSPPNCTVKSAPIWVKKAMSLVLPPAVSAAVVGLTRWHCVRRSD